MSGQERRGIYVAFVLAVSIFGLTVSAILLGNPAPFLFPGSDGRRILMAVLYDSVCVVGMLAVLFPVPCAGVIGSRRFLPENAGSLQVRTTRVLGVLLLHGHHPLGSETVAHELRLGNKTFCASCYGMFAGAFISLTAVTVFAFLGSPVFADARFAYVLYCGGVAGVIPGLLQALVLNTGARVRFVLATLFVVGTSLMLIATDVLTSSLTADLFVLMLAVFWLLSRLSLSHRSKI